MKYLQIIAIVCAVSVGIVSCGGCTLPIVVWAYHKGKKDGKEEVQVQTTEENDQELQMEEETTLDDTEVETGE